MLVPILIRLFPHPPKSRWSPFKPLFLDAAAIYKWVLILLATAIIILLVIGVLAFYYERFERRDKGQLHRRGGSQAAP